jgi:hypothetical protein
MVDDILSMSTSELIKKRMNGEELESFVRNIYAARWALENDITPETMSKNPKEGDEADDENSGDTSKPPKDPPAPPTIARLNTYDPAVNYALRRIRNNPREFGNIPEDSSEFIKLVEEISKQYEKPKPQFQRVYQTY